MSNVWLRGFGQDVQFNETNQNEKKQLVVQRRQTKKDTLKKKRNH
jgi:hypothetical protein